MRNTPDEDNNLCLKCGEPEHLPVAAETTTSRIALQLGLLTLRPPRHSKPLAIIIEAVATEVIAIAALFVALQQTVFSQQTSDLITESRKSMMMTTYMTLKMVHRSPNTQKTTRESHACPPCGLLH